MWELDGWDGLAANFAHETGGGRDQDPSLAEWWAAAASLRRGGVDRIVVPTPWTRSVEQLIADGVRGEVYAHELVHGPAGHERRAARRGRRRRARPRCEALGPRAGRRLRGGHGRRLRGAAALGHPRLGDVGRLRAGLGARRRAGARGARRSSASARAGGASCSSTPRSRRSAPAASRRRPTAAPWRRSDGASGRPAVITDDGHRPPAGADQRARAVAAAAAPPRASPPTPSGTWPRPTATTTRCGATPPTAPPPAGAGRSPRRRSSAATRSSATTRSPRSPADQKALMKGDPLRGVHAFYSLERPGVVGAAACPACRSPGATRSSACSTSRASSPSGRCTSGRPGVPRRSTARCCRRSPAT